MSAANDDRRAEKSYRVVGNTGNWAISEDTAEPAGDYATREGALEAIYLAASNDIKKGLGVTTIRIDPPETTIAAQPWTIDGPKARGWNICKWMKTNEADLFRAGALLAALLAPV